MSGANYHSDLRTRLGRDYTSLARWMGPGTQRGRPARSQTIGRVLQRLPTGTDGARPIARRVISLDRSNSEMLTRFGLKPSLEAVRSTLMHAPNADRWMQLSSEPIPNTVAYQVFKGDLPTARDELASRINAGEDCTLELWLLLERAGGRDVDSALQVSIVDLACKGFHTDNYPLLFNRVLNEKRPEALRALRSVFEDQMFIENISNLIHALGAEQAFRELQKLAIHPGSVFAWISEQDNRGDLVNTFARVYPQALEVLQEMRQDQLPTDALLELLHAYFDGQPSELNCLAEGALALDSPDVFEEIISLIKLTQPLLLQAPVDKYETTLLDTIFEWMPLDPWVYVAACMPTNLGVDVRRILKHCSLNPESVGDASRKVLESLFELHGQMPTTLCLRMTRESLENYAIRKLQDPVSLAIVLEHGSEWTELLDEDIFNATEDNSIKLRLLEAWLAGYSPTNPDQAELADHIAIQVNALSPEDFAVLIEGNPNIRLPLTKAMLRGMFKGQNELGFDDFKSAALEIALCEAEAALEDNRDQALLFASWRIQVASRAELTAQLHLVPGIIAVTNGATCVLDALFSKFDEYGIWMTAFESVDSDDESLPLISQLIVLSTSNPGLSERLSKSLSSILQAPGIDPYVHITAPILKLPSTSSLYGWLKDNLDVCLPSDRAFDHETYLRAFNELGKIGRDSAAYSVWQKFLAIDVAIRGIPDFAGNYDWQEIPVLDHLKLLPVMDKLREQLPELDVREDLVQDQLLKKLCLGNQCVSLPYQPGNRFRDLLIHAYFRLHLNLLTDELAYLENYPITDIEPSEADLRAAKRRGEACGAVVIDTNAVDLNLFYLQPTALGSEIFCRTSLMDREQALAVLNRHANDLEDILSADNTLLQTTTNDTARIAIHPIPHGSYIRRPRAINDTFRTLIVTPDHIPFAVLVPMMEGQIVRVFRFEDGQTSDLDTFWKETSNIDSSIKSVIAAVFGDHQIEVDTRFSRNPNNVISYDQPEVWIHSNEVEWDLELDASGAILLGRRGRSIDVTHENLQERLLWLKQASEPNYDLGRAIEETCPPSNSYQPSLPLDTAIEDILCPLLNEDSLAPYMDQNMVAFGGLRAPVESCKELLRTRLSGIRTGELLGMDPNSEASQRLRHASLILAEKLPQMDPEVRTPHLLRLALDDGTCFTGTEYLIHECAATITGGLRQDFASSPQTQIVRWWDECKEAVALQQCHRALWLANDPELTGQSVHILNAIRAAMAGRLLTLGDETVSDTSENGIAFPSISTDVFAQSMLIQLVQGITMEEAEELPPKKYARNLIEYSDHYQKLGVKWLASTFPPFLAEKVNSVFETGLTDADSAKLMNAWVRELAVHFFKNLPQGCIRDEIRKEVRGAKEQAKKKGEEITEKAESVRDIQVEYTAYKEELAFLRDFQEIGKRKREETEEESKVQRVQPPIYAELMEIIEEEIGFLPIYYHEEFNLLREEQRFFQENVIFNAKVKCLMEHPAFLKALCGPEGYFEVSGGLDLQNLDFMEHELRITERGAIALAEMYLGWEKKV